MIERAKSGSSDTAAHVPYSDWIFWMGCADWKLKRDTLVYSSILDSAILNSIFGSSLSDGEGCANDGGS